LSRLPIFILGAWTALTFAIVFARDGLSADNITHLAILGYAVLSLALVRPLRRLAARHPRRWFIAASVVSALVVEACYMITAPLHPALLVTANTSAGAALRNYGVDILFATPAYLCIFALVWWLLRRYRYPLWAFALFIPAGQALGDGQAFFLANPPLLLFLPYVMANYQAMTLAPFLAIGPSLPDRSGSRWAAFLLPLVLLPLCYGICGTVVLFAGRRLGFF
jgi:hypothetical protein